MTLVGRGALLLIFFLFLPVSSALTADFSDYAPAFKYLRQLADAQDGASGVYVLETGEEALLARSWMIGNAGKSIDILTFIWSLDRIGLVATDALLRAAERGVRVRAVIDDIVLKKKDLDILLALSAHPNFDIRIYNPQQTVGVSPARVVYNLLVDFRRFNHRLHNKTFLADGFIGLTGGRNVADEYFGYNEKYDFRDREILVAGPVAVSMRDNFEKFWQSELSRPIENLLPARRASFSPQKLTALYAQLHACADQLIIELPLVRRILGQREEQMESVLERMVWTPQVWFVSDRPGKNLGKPGLGGGGAVAEAIHAAIAAADKTIVLQSPYLVLEGDGYGLIDKLREGVEVWISTNSLAATDNISAFSGYARQRQVLLDSGMVIREFRPDPAIGRDVVHGPDCREKKTPKIVLHAKTLVVDAELLYIGTFNIDPRSAHLNTEEGVFVRNRELAAQVEDAILREMLPENSWDPRQFNPNRKAGWLRRLGLFFYRLLPIQALL